MRMTSIVNSEESTAIVYKDLHYRFCPNRAKLLFAPELFNL